MQSIWALDPRAGAFAGVDGLAHAQDSQLADCSCAAPWLHGAYRDRGLARSQDFARRSRSGSGSPASVGAIARAGRRRLEINGRRWELSWGPCLFMYVLLASILVSGLMAVVEVMRTHRVRSTMQNLYVLVRGFLVFGLRKNPEISLDNPGLLKLPFGVAVAAATVICYCAARWGV